MPLVYLPGGETGALKVTTFWIWVHSLWFSVWYVFGLFLFLFGFFCFDESSVM